MAGVRCVRAAAVLDGVTRLVRALVSAGARIMTASTAPIVEIEDVTKTFGSLTAVDNLSLSVPQGSIYGFIGPNGSGKTTTLRMIMRIYFPDSGTGRIRVLGMDDHTAATDRIGYLPEERGLYKKMKVSELLRFYAELKGRRDFKSAVAEWLDRFELSDWANKKIETLSKGMAQKVQFISAVIHRPELVILDEPFTGLDPVNANVLRDAVLELRRSGTTVIFSTHDMRSAEEMCDFVFMIFRGQKVLDGTLDDIKATYSKDTIRVDVDADGFALDQIPGVESVTDFGRLHELRITEGTDTQRLLEALMQAGRVSHFELTQPSLHDIFVRIAGPEAQKAQAASEALEAHHA